jgi:hypothetical protein
VAPIYSTLLTFILYFSVRAALVYNDTKYSVPFMMLYGLQKEEITGVWRMLQDEEHQTLCFLSNVVRVIKLQRMYEQDV